MDPQGWARPTTLHPVRVLRWHLHPVRGGHRQPGLAARVDRGRQVARRQGLPRHLRRRREPGVQGFRRRRLVRRSDRPSHGQGHDGDQLAALHGGVHGAAARRAPGERRDRPQPGLLPCRDREPVRPQGDRRRHAYRVRARLQRHGHPRRRRQVRVRHRGGLGRAHSLARQGPDLRRAGGLGARVRARELLPVRERAGRDRHGAGREARRLVVRMGDRSRHSAREPLRMAGRQAPRLPARQRARQPAGCARTNAGAREGRAQARRLVARDGEARCPRGGGAGQRVPARPCLPGTVTRRDRAGAARRRRRARSL